MNCITSKDIIVNGQQWSADYSPMRLQFHSNDPNRNGCRFDFETGKIIRDGQEPLANTSVALVVDWVTTVLLSFRADDHGLHAYFDEDAQMMMPAFELFQSGIVDESLRPTSNLSQAECDELKLPNPPTQGDVMPHVMGHYAESLEEAIEFYSGNGADRAHIDQLDARLTAARTWIRGNSIEIIAFSHFGEGEPDWGHQIAQELCKRGHIAPKLKRRR